MDRTDEVKKEKLFNFRPALFVAIFLIFGILFGYYKMLKGASAYWLLLLVPMLGLPLLFSFSWENFLIRLTVSFLLGCVFCIGFISFCSQIYRFQDNAYYAGQVDVLGEVENCKIQEEGAKLLLKGVYINGGEVSGRMVVYLADYLVEDIGIGDKVLLQGEVSTNTSTDAEYGFRTSDITKNTCYKLIAELCIQTGKSNDPFLLVRARMEEVVYAGMEEEAAGLTLALLTGDVSGVDDEIMENMRYGGIAHIFAVSGMNVGALYTCYIFLFSKTPLYRTPKPLRLILLTLMLFFYSGICGFSASVVRAAITCVVFYMTKLLSTGNDQLNTLGMAAILILLISPAELFGVGFQLSFMACLGLFLLTKAPTQVFAEIKRVYQKCFPRHHTEEEQQLLDRGENLPPTTGELVWRGISSLLSASIAAQIMTLPLLLIHFDFVSGWSLLLNFLFVPITDLLFTLLLVFISLCCILPTGASVVLLYAPSAIWSAAMLVFQIFDFSGFGLSGVQISLGICVCYYGGILFLTDKLNIPPLMRKVLAAACWVCFAFTLHVYNL